MTSARMRRGVSLRCADRRRKASARAFTVSASEDGAQSAARVPPSRWTVSAPSPGRTIMSAVMSCQRQHPAAIDEDAEFRRQRPKRGLADEHRFDVARNNMRVEGCRRIVGPKRARHDIADGFERRVGTGETRADDDLGEGLRRARTESPDLQIGARGEVDMTVAVAASRRRRSTAQLQRSRSRRSASPARASRRRIASARAASGTSP